MLTHTTGGLLTSIAGPLNHPYTVAYDALGLVAQVRDPLGGGLDQSRVDLGTNLTVLSTTTLSSVDTRTLILEASGDTTIAANFPDGTSQTTTLLQSGAQSVGSSDGTVANYCLRRQPALSPTTRLPANTSVQLPGGLQSTLSVSRSAALWDPSNPFAVADPHQPRDSQWTGLYLDL